MRCRSKIKTKEMKITLRHATFGIEMTVTSYGENAKIVEDVTDLDHIVNTNLIQNLRDVADELEEHNRVNGYSNKPVNQK